MSYLVLSRNGEESIHFLMKYPNSDQDHLRGELCHRYTPARSIGAIVLSYRQTDKQADVSMGVLNSVIRLPCSYT